MPGSTCRFETASPEETQALGEALGRLLEPGAVVALTGDLGSGKTVLVQGVALGLGFDGYVSSPSFVIVNEYPAPVPIYHVDLYRTEGDDPLAGLGYRELFWGDGVVLIEWAERAAAMLPDDRLEVEITADDRSTRRFDMRAAGGPAERALRGLAETWRARR